MRQRPPAVDSPVNDATSHGCAASLRGAVLRPGAAGCAAARRVWDALIERRPALIARCAGPTGPIAAVTVAREQGLPLAVRGGGRNFPRTFHPFPRDPRLTSRVPGFAPAYP